MANFFVTGATGFIGRQVVAALLERRHSVTGLHRGPLPPSLAGHPRFTSHRANLAKIQSVEKWRDVLGDAKAVINCVESGPTPTALFDACTQASITRFVHISRTGIDPTDDALMQTELDWVVVRPGLVYGRGSCGGTALLRGLAACPGAIPLAGDGNQIFQPICMDDLAGIISELCEASSFSRRIIEPVGPEVLTLKEILLKLRRWLDIPGQATVSLPAWLLNKLGLNALQQADTSTTPSFNGLYAPAARSMGDMLLANPASAQDRRHARLTLLAPIITAVLSLTWVTSGALGSMFGLATTQDVLSLFGLTAIDPRLLTWSTSGWAILLGLFLLTPLSTRLLTSLQVLTLVATTAVVSVAMPQLWLDPFGPLLKNIPILMLIGVWAVLRTRR